MKIQVPPDFHAAQVWERAIGMIKSPTRVESALFVPNGPMYPERNGIGLLRLNARRGHEIIPVGSFSSASGKIEPFQVCLFDLYELDRDLDKGDVLTLTKTTLETDGFAMPEFLVEVNLWP